MEKVKDSRDPVRLHWVAVFILGIYLCLAAIPPLRAITVLMESDDLSGSAYRAYGKFRNTSDVPWRDGWGITYQGAAGLALAFGHLIWILGGGLLVALTGGRWMWVGLTALFVWTVLWTGNAVYMQGVLSSPTPEGIPHALGLVLVSVLGWMAWRKRSGSRAA